MHTEVRQFIEKVRGKFPENFRNCRVLEVGSRDVNGSVREHFYNCRYTGIDLMPGKCVDVVSSCLSYYATAPGLFDTVISCESLEHDKDCNATIHAMYNMVKPGGLLLITAAGINRPRHGTYEDDPEDSPATLDYYSNLTEHDFAALTVCMGSHIEHNRNQQDIYYYGVKP